MNKHLLTVLVVAAALATKPATAQPHTGVPIAHTPVHQVKHVPPRVMRDYEDYITDNPFLVVTGQPDWTRQNGLLVARVEATGSFNGAGIAVLRFKPQGGLVLFDFEAEEELKNNAR